jgi:hypothetical protein
VRIYDIKVNLKGDLVPQELKAEPEEELRRREAWWTAFSANQLRHPGIVAA